MSQAIEPAPKEPAEHHITETKFWQEFMDDIFGARQGGGILFVDAENARKGVAKTSGAVAFASLLSKAFGYDLRSEDITLSGSHYLKRYQEHPGVEQPSVLVLDELVGAGTGDARRAMSGKNIDMGRAWALLRTKRVITLATLPDWNEIDPRLQKLGDYRIWCREKPIGTFNPYKITTPFSANGSGASVRTKAVSYDDNSRPINFPNMDAHDDPYYHYASELKDDLIHSAGWDADALAEGAEEEEEQLTEEEIERRELIKFTIRLYEPWDDENEHSYEDVAEALHERTDTWVGNRIREWKKGKHRDLVPDPTEQ